MVALLVTTFYAVLTFIITFPLLCRINYVIPGFFSTDEPSIWYYWWLEYSYLHKINYKFCNFLGYPFGIDLSALEKIFPFGTVIKKILVHLTNEFCAYNIEILSTFILSGLFAYLLVKYLTQNRWAAVFSGIVYSFCPYHFARAWQHSSLAHIQWFPLLLLGIFMLLKSEKVKINFFVIISIFAIFSYDLYYAYFAFTIIALFILFTAFFKKPKCLKVLFTNILVNSFLGAVVPFLCLLSFLFPMGSRTEKTAGAWNIAMRPFEDLFTQSARPLSYFIPSTEHPLLGGIAKNFIGTDIYGMSLTEHALYLGWIPLILAFVAVRRWRKTRKLGTVPYIGFFAFLAISAWFFSQPPWWDIFGFKLYMPSFFMYKILPMFRAYCRFGIVVMLAVAVLAGFGLKFILDKFKSKRTRIAVAIFFSCLVLFEFWNYPPFKVIDLSRVPQVYYWLKDEPGDFVIAEYPLDVNGPNELYKFYQTKHEKKIINGTIPGTDANKLARTIINVSEVDTTKSLRQIGVKYVLVHRDDYLKTELVQDREELEKIPQNTGLQFIRTFSSEECPEKNIICVQKTGLIDVYEVITSPLKPKM